MRAAKQYLVQEVESYLEDPHYFFLADYRRVTVADVATLRKDLRKVGARYHVVKKNILNLVAKKKGLPEITHLLEGQLSMISGGKNPTEVAKILLKFSKEREKLSVKGGILDGRSLGLTDVQALSSLPSLEVLRSQFLGLLVAPMQQLMSVMQGVPKSVLYVLQAKAEKAS